MNPLHALRFLTVLPVPRGRVDERALGRASGWFPLAGAVLGAILAGASWAGGRLWPPLAVGAVVTVLWAVLTRGLHLDGLADSADGLGGAFTRERRLEIMKDSRVGVFGVLAVAAVLLLKTAFLAGVPPSARLRLLVAVPVMGRWAMLLVLFAFPAAGEGMGRRFKGHCRWPQLAVGTVTAGAAAAALFGLPGLGALGGVGAAAALCGLGFTRALGGLTGDGYGAVCELAECLALAVLAALPGSP